MAASDDGMTQAGLAVNEGDPQCFSSDGEDTSGGGGPWGLALGAVINTQIMVYQRSGNVGVS
jgi:hypothetical protein